MGAVVTFGGRKRPRVIYVPGPSIGLLCLETKRIYSPRKIILPVLGQGICFIFEFCSFTNL